jgi:hypothetical protein
MMTTKKLAVEFTDRRGLTGEVAMSGHIMCHSGAVALVPGPKHVHHLVESTGKHLCRQGSNQTQSVRVEFSLLAGCKSKHCMPHSPIVLPDTNTFRAVMVTLRILPPPVATMLVATPCKNPPPKRTARLRTAVTPSASTLQFTTSPPTVVPKPWRTHATKDFKNKA